MDAHGGGRGRRRERAHDLEVAAPLSGRGRAGTARSLLGSLACSAADQRAADRADRGAPSLADDRRRDRGSAFDAALDGVGDLDSDRARQAVAARAARAARAATRNSVPASSSTSTSRNWAGSGVPGTALPAGSPGGVSTAASATSAGSSYMWRSTTRPASSTSKSSTTRRPRTNGKAERFIRTLLAGWAYGAIYRNSHERRRALTGWVDHYTRRRPHRSLGRQTPLERRHTLNRNNLLGSYS